MRTRAAHPTRTLVGLSVATVAGHVLYPAALAVVSQVRGRRHVSTPGVDGALPGISVVIPAFREVGTIGPKIDDLRANGYPGVLEIVVVAEDAETAAAARDAGVVVVEPEERLGKSQALNVGVTSASQEIIVMTDANNQLERDALALLVAHFVDESVGGVAGAKSEDGGGEALYWRYEAFIKDRESRLGTTIGMVGELLAVRRSAWRPIPPGVGSDDLWIALDLNERGYSVRFEPAARSIEASVVGDEQWERRTRISAGALNVFLRKRHLLSPRRPLLAFEIVGHKLWRSTASPVFHAALLVVALRHRRTWLARAILAAHLVPAPFLRAQRQGRRVPRALEPVCQVLYLQGVAVGGMYRFLRHGDSPTWQKQQR